MDFTGIEAATVYFQALDVRWYFGVWDLFSYKVYTSVNIVGESSYDHRPSFLFVKSRGVMIRGSLEKCLALPVTR